MIEFIPNAVLDDPRLEHEINKDYVHEELFSGLPVTWIEKPQSEWITTSNRDQSNSFSCVKQSAATAIEILTKKIISAGTYKLRSNAPDGGMFLQNCGDLDYNVGVSLESECPSQKMTEIQMDSIVLPNLSIKISGYRTFNDLTIDKIAEAIQAYGQCMITFGSNSQEWKLTPEYLGTPITFGHAIEGVDFTLINGIKTIICRDSAGKWSSPTGLRLITEDFLNKRGKDAMYYLGIKKPVIEQEVPQTLWNQCMQFIKAWKQLFN